MNNNLTNITFIVPIKNEAINVSLLVHNAFILYNEVNIIFVYEDENEDSLPELIKLSKKYNIRYSRSKRTGVTECIKHGLGLVKTKFSGILLADDLGVLYRLDDIYKTLIENENSLVSGTRYKNGGKRLYGSAIEHFFSKIANKVFFILFNVSDTTTAFKFSKTSFLKETLKDKDEMTWGINLIITFSAIEKNISILEVPVISIDRLKFGISSFRLRSWVKRYLKIFLMEFKFKRNRKK